MRLSISLLGTEVFAVEFGTPQRATPLGLCAHRCLTGTTLAAITRSTPARATKTKPLSYPA